MKIMTMNTRQMHLLKFRQKFKQDGAHDARMDCLKNSIECTERPGFVNAVDLVLSGVSLADFEQIAFMN